MNPGRFLDSSAQEPAPKTEQEPSGPTVTVTIRKPQNLDDGIQFPPAPTALGKVTETITKSTFTETVVTRVTDNKLVYPDNKMVVAEVNFI